MELYFFLLQDLIIQKLKKYSKLLQRFLLSRRLGWLKPETNPNCDVMIYKITDAILFSVKNTSMYAGTQLQWTPESTK